jgi:hypothetical protein
MAVGQALGAAPKRLMSQLLTKTLLLSMVGGVFGLAILLLDIRSDPAFRATSLLWPNGQELLLQTIFTCWESRCCAVASSTNRNCSGISLD